MYDTMNTSGVDIAEHAHDRNVSVNKIIKTKGVRNVNERWHVAKSITSGMKKLGRGTKVTKGKTWHPQLDDKTAAVRDHVYWSIDHCQGDKNTLRDLLDVCIHHFQNKHDFCHITSTCRQLGPRYIPSFTVIDDPVAVRLLTDFLHSHVVYKNAEDYVVARDTYYVESFNNVCLVYIPKRIHIRNRLHYEMRMGLAILDWNEHVDRDVTSHYHRQAAENHRQRRGRRTLTVKTFGFVQDIWSAAVGQCNADEEEMQEADEDSTSDSFDEDIDVLN